MKLLLLILTFFIALTSADAKTYFVSKQAGHILSLKKAIALAQNGDTIVVEAGLYKEGNIILEKSLTILGHNLPVLDGEHKYEILTIHADNVTIQGLKFINTGVASINDIAAIKILDSKGIHITNNQFENAFFGIYLANSSQSRIENNVLTAKGTYENQIGNGIHLWKCEHVTIHNNVVKGHRDGIYFEFVTNSLITNNHSEGNLRYGLHFMFSHNDDYLYNRFINNGAGVAVMYTKNVKMIGNLFEQNWGSSAYGLLLKDIRDSQVSQNQFTENSIGIHLEGVSRTQFESNTFKANGYAIRLQASSDDNVFTKNNFSSNTFDMATNGTLVLNKINNNYWDKYQGYDLNKDGIGDVPFHPVSIYAIIVERIPAAVLLWRSFLVTLIDRAEKAIPVLTPENLKDDFPTMKPYDLAATSK
ncbi:MAG TPA: nitrous oxide reductase family maturation protein NosD [Chryseolinea sp.]